MAKRKPKPKPITKPEIEPVAEHLNHGQYARVIIPSEGVRWRRVPVIDVLLKAKLLTDREYEMLAYYRDQACLAEKSPVRSCCDNSPRGGSGPGVAILSAAIETGRIERDLGALRDIARAIAVDDRSLAQWCIDKHGGRERYNDKGKFVAVVPINEKRHMALARMELRMAAHRICR